MCIFNNLDGFLKEDVVMMSFFPEFPACMNNDKMEFIFIIDRSGKIMT